MSKQRKNEKKSYVSEFVLSVFPFLLAAAPVQYKTPPCGRGICAFFGSVPELVTYPVYKLVEIGIVCLRENYAFAGGGL